jgi:hypothetical protein
VSIKGQPDFCALPSPHAESGERLQLAQSAA